MADANEKELEPEKLSDPETILGDNDEDLTDWKAETFKRTGIGKRWQTKAEKLAEELDTYKTAHPETKEPPKPQDKKDFDLAEKTYILANGLKKEQIPLVLEEIKNSGRPISEESINLVLESNLFKEKLEKLASEEATPSGEKRGGSGARNTVDYWLKKGELPPRDGTQETTELRRKVANARATQEKSTKHFTDNPIVGN